MTEQIALESALVIAGSKKQPFVVSFSEYSGKKLLDVRKYYLDNNTGETKPTRKGVSLNRLQFEVLHRIFNEKSDEIEEWFDLEETEKTSELRAVQNIRLAATSAEIAFDSWSGLEMFRYRRMGNEAVLHLNTRHPWVEDFRREYESESETSRVALKLTLSLLDSFFSSVALLDPKNENSNEVMETVLANWGIFAKRHKSEDC